MTPFVGNYTPEQLEQGRKDIAETSPEKIEQLYRMGKIGLTDKIEMLRGYGQMKRELQIRDMSASGTGGTWGEINGYIEGVAREGQAAWLAAMKMIQSEPKPDPNQKQILLNGKPLIDSSKFKKSQGALAGEAVFHSLMTGLEALKIYDIPGNIVERKFLELGMDPSYARAANWAAWMPFNFFGIKATLKGPFALAGAGVRSGKDVLKAPGQAVSNYMKWVRDPIGEATKSAMMLNDLEKAHVLGQLDQAILQTETGQAFKKIADAVTAGEVFTSAKEAPAVSAEVIKRGTEFMQGNGARSGLEGFVDNFVPTPDDFEKAAISDLIKFYEQKSNVYIRKGVSHATTEAQAVGKMSFEELISRPAEQAMSAAELAYTGRVNDAIRKGMESTIQDALPHVEDMAAGKRPDLVGLFKAHFQAFAQTNPVFLGASGEVGRGLEFMKVLQPEVKAARMYDTMLKGLASDKLAESSDAAIAKALMKLSLLEKDARKAFLDASTKTDSPSVWHSLYKSMLFIMPRTHATNFIGQNQGAVTQMLQYTGSAMSTAADTPSLQSAWALWKGFGSAWLHLPRIWRQATERSVVPLEKLGLEGTNDAVARYGPLRWMGFGDELVGAALENAYVNAFATERAVKEGLNGNALADFVNGLKADPKVLTELVDQAAPIVRHAMYHDPLSPIGETIAGAIRRTKADFWLPVVKFPIASLKATRDWTPGLQFFNSKFMEDLAAGGAREAEARTRTTLSWMFSNYLWGEAKTGNLTGGGPTDPEKNKAWQAAGNKPYSWRGVPYRWAEPIGTVVGTVADMGYFSNQMEPDDVEDFTAGLSISLARMVQNNYWLRTMEGVTGVVSGMSKPENLSDFFMQAQKVLLAPFVTVGTGGPLGGTIREMIDPEVKQINSFGDYFLGKVPGYSKNVSPMLNYSGAVKEIPPVLGHRWLGIVLPSGLRSGGTNDPVGAFLHKHGLELPDNWKSFGGVDDERPLFEPGQGKISPQLSSDQSHNWKLLSLTDVKRYDGLTWTEKIAELDANPAFAAKSRYAKQRQISMLYGNYRDKGKKMLSNVDPEVAVQLELAKEKTREMRGKGTTLSPEDADAVPEEMDTGPQEQPQMIEQQPIEQPVEAPAQ